MTFRVRFTDRFGRKGIIQRKAFEFISDALAKKGIHFAHRKVIVKVPRDHEKDSGATPMGSNLAAEVADHIKVGAAEALPQMLADEEQKKGGACQKERIVSVTTLDLRHSGTKAGHVFVFWNVRFRAAQDNHFDQLPEHSMRMSAYSPTARVPVLSVSVMTATPSTGPGSAPKANR
jgi:hypothetical protein